MALHRNLGVGYLWFAGAAIQRPIKAEQLSNHLWTYAQPALAGKSDGQNRVARKGTVRPENPRITADVVLNAASGGL
jgi:hypothetical protein